MTIRPATPDDYPEITSMLDDFHRAAASRYTKFDKASATKTIAHLATLPTGTVLVAVGAPLVGALCAGQPPPIQAFGGRQGLPLQGFIAGIIVPVFLDYAQLQAHECFWWIRPEARGTGAGSALLAALEQWAIDGGAKTLTMVAFHGSGHEAVGDLYRRRGYAPLEHHYVMDFECTPPSSS